MINDEQSMQKINMHVSIFMLVAAYLCCYFNQILIYFLQIPETFCTWPTAMGKIYVFTEKINFLFSCISDFSSIVMEKFVAD